MTKIRGKLRKKSTKMKENDGFISFEKYPNLPENQAKYQVI